MLKLDDLLVVSVEQAVAAPFCSNRLAQAGARVIKIERAEGDFARGYDNVVHGESAYFVWLNQGKESLVADIKSEADSALLHRCWQRLTCSFRISHPVPPHAPDSAVRICVSVIPA